MKNLEIYINVFTNSLKVDAKILKNLKYQDVPAWDSLGHMNLIRDLEEAFDIMIDMDDIIDFSSYKIGIEILKKYNIEITEK